jgi:acetyl-CoA synthetase
MMMDHSGGNMALPNPGKTSAVAPPSGQLLWDDALGLLAGPAAETLNIAVASVDRHVAAGNGERVALRWLGRRQERRDYTYAELSDLSGQAAAVLAGLGLKPGETVAVLLGRVPEFYAATLGVWKAGGVFCPLFAAFGPGPVKSRLELGQARVLITSDRLYAGKVAASRAALPGLRHVLLVGDEGGAAQAFEGCLDFRALLAAAEPMAPVKTHPGDPAFLHFTSGTTGIPKGAVQPHLAVVSHLMTGRQVFGLGEDDIFWCTADPGWVTSTGYGVIAPLVNGATLIADEAEIDPRRWYAILRDERVSAWYTTPTAIRTLMRYGAALARTYRQNSLRVAASVGEPLNPEAVVWGQKALGVPFLDTWWQTEVGAIAIANLPGCRRRPGSMGRPLPGIEAAVVCRGNDGLVLVDTVDTPGELALRAGWPSMFTGYLGDCERYGASFVEGWYLTGDLVKRDQDGFYWFLGRSDDMIKSGGHQIGPFEVEGMLMDHPAVAEIGVVGRPDPLLREVPVAFVSLNPGFEPGTTLQSELLAYANQELGLALAPRDVVFVEALPKTSSGKIMRRVLKAKAAGELDEAAPVPLQPCPSHFADE